MGNPTVWLAAQQSGDNLDKATGCGTRKEDQTREMVITQN